MTKRKITIHNVKKEDLQNIAIYFSLENINFEIIEKLKFCFEKIGFPWYSFDEAEGYDYICFNRGSMNFCSHLYVCNKELQIIEIEDFLCEDKEEQETFDYKTALKKAIDREKVKRKVWEGSIVMELVNINNRDTFVVGGKEKGFYGSMCEKLITQEDIEATDWMIYQEPKTMTKEEAIKKGLRFKENNRVYSVHKDGILWCDKPMFIKVKPYIVPAYEFINIDKQVTIIEE